MSQQNGKISEIFSQPNLSRPEFWDLVSEGIRRANPVLVTNYFEEKVLLKWLSV